jgi:hypothetical protein
MRVTGTLAAALTLVALAVAPALAQSGAKALFYGSSGATVRSPTPAPAPQARSAPARDQYAGIAYWVELLDRTGQLRRVTTGHPFRGGDRIRLSVQSNRDGYLYLMNVGSTGRTTMLFPSTGAPEMIRAGQVYQVPANAFLRFDVNPGQETLLIMLSAAPLPGLGPAGTTTASASPPSSTDASVFPPAPQPGIPPPGPPASQAGIPPPGPPAADASAPPPSPYGGTPSMAPPPADSPAAFPGPPTQPAPGTPPSDAAAFLQRTLAKGAKDLVVEVDAQSTRPASYAVAPVSSVQNDGPITVRVVLRHE